MFLPGSKGNNFSLPLSSSLKPSQSSSPLIFYHLPQILNKFDLTNFDQQSKPEVERKKRTPGGTGHMESKHLRMEWKSEGLIRED